MREFGFRASSWSCMFNSGGCHGIEAKVGKCLWYSHDMFLDVVGWVLTKHQAAESKRVHPNSNNKNNNNNKFRSRFVGY
jgi:hypothetical protein